MCSCTVHACVYPYASTEKITVSAFLYYSWQAWFIYTVVLKLSIYRVSTTMFKGHLSSQWEHPTFGVSPPKTVSAI